MSTEENKDQPQTPTEDEGNDTNNENEETLPSTREIERQEEEKLKAKFPNALGGGLMGGPRGVPGAHSQFLQKRLQKGQKYFDSGDYQMAKQKGGGIKQVFANKVVTTGEAMAIPTPETVPARKTSIIQPPCNKFTTS